MTETRKQIIEYLYSEEQRLGREFIDKTLSEGCIVDLLEDGYTVILDESLLDEEMMTGTGSEAIYQWFYKEDCIDKILGHYGITSILKYIEEIFEYHSFEIKGDRIEIQARGYDLEHFIGSFPNKPLHLYTEQEDKDLFELLQKLGHH